jgi:uncharacterized membrane protein (DUF485 family)
MVGLMQIMIYLFCVYLGYKGIEIFQIAFMSTSDKKKIGMILGVIMVIGAVIVAAGALYMTETQVSEISKTKTPWE